MKTNPKLSHPNSDSQLGSNVVLSPLTLIEKCLL